MSDFEYLHEKLKEKYKNCIKLPETENVNLVDLLIAQGEEIKEIRKLLNLKENHE